MIKKIAWDTFKNTGDINSFLEYKQIENLEKISQTKNEVLIDEIGKIQKITNMKLENNETWQQQNKWNYIIRK